jgi:hypothetical protein
MKHVEVEWKDIISQNDWTDADDLDKAIAKAIAETFFTTGYIYEKTDDYIVILPSASFNEDDELESASYEIIPMGVVVKITPV